MAVTKIWGIKGRLDRVIRYAANPVKTWNESFDEARQLHNIDGVIQYTVDELKTEKQYYVSGVNCDSDPTIAAQQFAKSLERAARPGYVCFHGYQSFLTNEATPEKAHAVGVELAKRLWGDKYEVLVSTHVNTRTVHNHFVLSAVSFVDGKRYYANQSTYRDMRRMSDEICREYGLIVIDDPKRKNGRNISEIKAGQEGRFTERGEIRRNIDAVIVHNTTFRYWWRELEQLGYTLEYRGKYLRIRPDGKKGFFRLDKLGEGYTEQDIRDRLDENFRNPNRSGYVPFTPPRHEKAHGLHALYLHYLYLLGELPKSKPDNKQMYLYMREDLKKMEKYSNEAKLLGRYRIDTAEQLHAFTDDINKEFIALAIQRKKLRNSLRRMTDTEIMQPIRDSIAELSDRMSEIRKKMKLCEDVAERSGVIEYIVNTIEEPNKNQSKERKRE